MKDGIPRKLNSMSDNHIMHLELQYRPTQPYSSYKGTKMLPTPPPCALAPFPANGD